MTDISGVFANNLDIQLKKISSKQTPRTEKQVCRAISVALLECFLQLPARKIATPRAAYFSAEILPGSFITQSVAALGVEDIFISKLKENGFAPEFIERLKDPALGNGGLGRLAACLLDSAAARDIPLDGYGIRYKYGIFKQNISGNEQIEEPDFWQADSFLEKEQRTETQTIHFGDGDVIAVPFDVPIVSKSRLNRLRLWQCEAVNPVNFSSFAKGDMNSAFKNQNSAEAISAFLYPPDDTNEGKALRLKQQYFFTAASVGSILDDFKKTGNPINELPNYIKIQLNDTHPTVAVLELLRRLCEEYSLEFDSAFDIVKRIFSYTNHTVMAEALESWSESLFCKILPTVYPYAVMLNNHLHREINDPQKANELSIIKNGYIRMANIAVFCSHKINGVAKIHTDIIKESVFKDWYNLYPDRFLNITNGISHRRWLCLANKELSAFADDRIGTDWRYNLTELEKICNFNSNEDLEALKKIKTAKKKQLCDYLKHNMNICLDPDFMFSIQIKRIHEYKRQLLNILGVLGLYIDLKSGEIPNFHPTAFIFAGKAAPGYFMAKQVIKLINATATLLEKDETARKYLKVVFVPDYNVKNAMKLIPAADLSEQISTAGTEASGTGNMKLSLNGAATIGTLDGATIEIVNHAGKENNYIFGATKEELNDLYDYDPMNIYYTNDKISRVIDLLKDGPAGDFEQIFKSLLFGNGYDPADKYKVLLDYPSYYDARLNANEDYKNKDAFAKKSLMNIAGASHFSSDSTITEYNENIWRV